MRSIICAHSIYRDKPRNFLDDLSLKDLKNINKTFDISFDDGYRSVYIYGRDILNEMKTKTYIFINPGFIETKKTVWWFEIQDLINLKNEISFKYHGKFITINIYTRREKDKAYRILSKIFKSIDQSQQEYLLTNLKNSSYRNDYSERFMTWEMIRELASFKNITIGSHTHNHIKLKNENKDIVLREMLESKFCLEKQINNEIIDFAIPYGDINSYSKEDIRIAQKVGYKYIYTTNANIFAKKKDKLDPYIVNRLCTRTGYNNKIILIVRLFIKSIRIYVFSRFNNHNL